MEIMFIIACSLTAFAGYMFGRATAMPPDKDEYSEAAEKEYTNKATGLMEPRKRTNTPRPRKRNTRIKPQGNGSEET